MTCTSDIVDLPVHQSISEPECHSVGAFSPSVQCAVPVGVVADFSSLSDMLREGKGHKICSYQSECTCTCTLKDSSDGC